MVGSKTQRVAHYIGYPQIVVHASILHLSSQSLQPPIFDQFLLILRTLPLEPLGRKVSMVHKSSLYFPWTLRLFLDVLTALFQSGCFSSLPFFLGHLTLLSHMISSCIKLNVHIFHMIYSMGMVFTDAVSTQHHLDDLGLLLFDPINQHNNNISSQ